MFKISRFGIAQLLWYLGIITVSISPASAQLNPDNTLGNEQSVIVPIDVNKEKLQLMLRI
ncbi:MAG: hypothetical protein AAF915_12425 [Cyanobacteria bacterium P01_D01_bin.50]